MQSKGLRFVASDERLRNAGAVFVGAFEMPAAAEVPTEIQLLPFGEWKGYKDNDGNPRVFKVTRELAASAVAHQEERKRRNPDRDLVIDFEHQTLTNDQSPAAGWFNDLFLKEDGLYARVKSWTDQGLKHLRERTYRYLSPVFAFDVDDKVTGQKVPLVIFNAALTNEPFFDELKPLVAKNNPTIYQINNTPSQGDSIMDPKVILAFIASLFGLTGEQTFDTVKAKLSDFRQSIAATLNIDAASTLDAIKAKATEFKQNYDTFTATYKEVLTAIGLKPEASVQDVKAFATSYKEMLTALALQPGAPIEEIKAKLIIAKSNLTTLDQVTAELNALKQTLVGDKFEAVIAKGLETGRITPAQKQDSEWLNAQRGWAEKNFTAFQDYFTTKAPQVVPLSEIKIRDQKAPSSTAITEEELVVGSALGITKEQMQKHKLQAA